MGPTHDAPRRALSFLPLPAYKYGRPGGLHSQSNSREQFAQCIENHATRQHREDGVVQAGASALPSPLWPPARISSPVVVPETRGYLNTARLSLYLPVLFFCPSTSRTGISSCVVLGSAMHAYFFYICTSLGSVRFSPCPPRSRLCHSESRSVGVS